MAAQAEIEAVRDGDPRQPNTGDRDDLVYPSCLSWIDFTGLTNALPGPTDCILRISWGKFVTAADGRTSCAIATQVHHAIADGAHIATVLADVQDTLDDL